MIVSEEQSVRQRDKYQIRYDILKLLADSGMAKTKLMQLAVISWISLNEELDALDKMQLLEYPHEYDKNYYITDKGREFIDTYEKLMEIYDTRKLE